MKGSGNYDQKNYKTSNPNKSPVGEMKGTLNFPYKKREAIKIDQENVQMAKRIVKTNSTFDQSQLHNDYKQEQRKVGFEIDQIVAQQRSKYSTKLSDSKSIVFPDIIKSNASIKSPKTQRSIAGSQGGLPEIEDTLPDPTMGSKGDLRAHKQKRGSPYNEANLRKMMNSPEMR